MTSGKPSVWLPAAIAVNALLIVFVFGGYLDMPLRLYDHQQLLLLTHQPGLVGDGFGWRQIHYHPGSETDIHFRYLCVPLAWNLLKVFKDHPDGLYIIAFLAHGAASLTLCRAVQVLTGLPWLALLVSSLFTVFSAHSDSVGVPFYTCIFLATTLAGLAAIRIWRHRSNGRLADLVGAMALLFLASMIYDTFFLAFLTAPFLSFALRGGSWRAGARTPAAWILGGAVMALFLIGSLAYSRVPEEIRNVDTGQSLRDTLGIILLRLPVATVTSAGRLLMDGTVFLSGRTPAAAHPGNMPYWEVGSMLFGGAVIAAAAAAMSVGASLCRMEGWLRRFLGTAFLAAGLALDWRAIPLALLAFLAIFHSPLRIHRNPAFLLPVVMGFLCALNTAMGRSRLYSLAAIRHHYVTSFFALMALAIVVRQTLAQGPSRLVTGAVAVALTGAIALNAAAARRFSSDYRATNATVLSFDAELAALARDGHAGSLFVPHSTSEIRSPDCRRHSLHDWMFDTLHFRNDPLTRHTARARWLWEQGTRTPNPLLESPDSPDFLIRFRLDTERFPLRFDVKPAYALFGRQTDEPRLVLRADRVSLVVSRLGDRQERAYDFPLPVPTNRFFYESKTVSLERAGGTLTLRSDDSVLGACNVSPDDEYRSWQGDNTDLLGSDGEILLFKHNLYDSYIRIGPKLEGRIP